VIKKAKQPIFAKRVFSAEFCWELNEKLNSLLQWMKRLYFYLLWTFTVQPVQKQEYLLLRLAVRDSTVGVVIRTAVQPPPHVCRWKCCFYKAGGQINYIQNWARHAAL